MAGSLRQRGRTSWQLRVLAGRDEITGKQCYFSKTFRGGRREAERELARLVADESCLAGALRRFADSVPRNSTAGTRNSVAGSNPAGGAKSCAWLSLSHPSG